MQGGGPTGAQWHDAARVRGRLCRRPAWARACQSRPLLKSAVHCRGKLFPSCLAADPLHDKRDLLPRSFALCVYFGYSVLFDTSLDKLHHTTYNSLLCMSAYSRGSWDQQLARVQ